MVHVLSQVNLDHALWPHFLNIHLNIILSTIPVDFRWPIFCQIFRLVINVHETYRPCDYLGVTYIWWRAEILTLLKIPDVWYVRQCSMVDTRTMYHRNLLFQYAGWKRMVLTHWYLTTKLCGIMFWKSNLHSHCHVNLYWNSLLCSFSSYLLFPLS
jgi:hypothetical protein